MTFTEELEKLQEDYFKKRRSMVKWIRRHYNCWRLSNESEIMLAENILTMIKNWINTK